MVYEYACPTCSLSRDVVKSVREMDSPETCAKCDSPMVRAFAPRRLHFTGTAVQEKKWQPAIGRACTDNELKKIARGKGMIELGTEKAERHLEPPTAEYPSFTDDDIAAIGRTL